jgi:hypothetical protein
VLSTGSFNCAGFNRLPTGVRFGPHRPTNAICHGIRSRPVVPNCATTDVKD